MLEHTFEVGPADDRNLVHASSDDLESFDRFVKLVEKTPGAAKPVRATIKRHKTLEDAVAFVATFREKLDKSPKPTADEIVENSVKLSPPTEVEE